MQNQDNSLVAVSSRLMENYHVGSPVSAGTQIATFKNRDGQVEVLSIGENFKLYNFYPDPEKDTGWSSIEVPLPEGTEALEIVTGTALDNSPVALVRYKNVKNNDNFITIPVIGFIRTGAPGTAFSIAELTSDVIGKNACVRSKPMSLRVYQDADIAQFGISFYTSDIDSNPDYFQVNFESNDGVNMLSVKNSLYFFENKDWSILKCNYPENISPHPLISTVYIENYKPFFITDRNYRNAFYFGEICNKIANISKPNVLLGIKQSDSCLVYMKSEFGSDAIVVPITNSPKNIPIKDVVGTTNHLGRPQAFVIGEDGHVYSSESTSENDLSWSELIIINNAHTFEHLAVSKAADGVPNLFAVTSNGELIRIYRDPTTTKWFSELVEYEAKVHREVEAFDSYSTEITVFDKGGLLRPQAKVKIWSSGNDNLMINGKGYILNAEKPIEVLTNGAGMVTIANKTNEIATSIIHVWTEFMDEHKGVAIQSNGYLQDDFKDLTGEKLLAANGSNGQLLKGKFRDQAAANSLAEALNSSMDVLHASSQAYFNTQFDNYSHVISGAKCHHVYSQQFGKPHAINFSQANIGSWQLLFNEQGLPVYTKLTENEAQLAIHQRTTAYANIESLGWFGIDWGGLWQKIKAGVAKIVEVVVTPIVNAVQNAVTVLVDGVKYIWNGIVTMVEQVFQSVSAFFHKVGVVFKDIVHWLGTVFNLKNIQRTKEAVGHSVLTMVDFVDDVVGIVKTRFVDKNITAFRNNISSSIDAYIQQLLPGEGMGAIGEKNGGSIKKNQAHKAEHNLILNPLINNNKKIQEYQVPIISGLEQLLGLVDRISNDFEAADAFKDAAKYFSEIGEKPDQFLELAMAALLDVVKGIALFAIDIVQALVDAIFEAIHAIIAGIKAALTSHIYIPVVSEIYKLMHGGEELNISFLDIMSIVIAVPTTVFCTAISGKAPFPDEASLTEFKQFVTVDTMRAKTGLGSMSKKLVAFSEEKLHDFGKFFNWMSGFNYAITGLLKPAVDLWAIGDMKAGIHHDPGLAAISKMECTLTWAGLVTSFPWAVEADVEPICESGTPENFDMVCWFVEVLGDGVMDTIFCIVEPEGRKESAITSIWGGIQLVFNAILAAKDPDKAYNIAKAFPNIFSGVRYITSQQSNPYVIAGLSGIIVMVDMSCNWVLSGFNFKQA